ncbi:MAG: hypothetical protein WCC17_21125 [Candidatus Nitrosopolaris sp.]|jgi:hypothetical protein
MELWKDDAKKHTDLEHETYRQKFRQQISDETKRSGKDWKTILTERIEAGMRNSKPIDFSKIKRPNIYENILMDETERFKQLNRRKHQPEFQNNL